MAVNAMQKLTFVERIVHVFRAVTCSRYGSVDLSLALPCALPSPHAIILCAHGGQCTWAAARFAARDPSSVEAARWADEAAVPYVAGAQVADAELVHVSLATVHHHR